MSSIPYVPLHLHTQYSLLDGAIKIDELLNKSKEFGLNAVAITDHGNIFGAVEFYKKANNKGIKPIIGCEVYVAPTSRLEKTKVTLEEDAEEYAFHLILLVQNDEGYRNLCQLITSSYLEGFYYKPRVDKEILRQHSKGLIALSACLKGEIPYYIITGQFEKAKEVLEEYISIFGKDNFYLEIQENGLPEQRIANEGIIKLSRLYDIPIVATNDCHYLNKEDARTHEILLCIQTTKTLKDPKHMRFSSDEFYFKSPQEMLEAFRGFEQAISNTNIIAQRCNFEFVLKDNYLPQYTPPNGQSPDDYLSEIAKEGLYKRFDGSPPQDYIQRLESELEMIKKMGFSAYLLIVWDFISFAKSRGIAVGPGRGSAAGSLVAYSIGITEIDPIKYGLLFERFLNPERISMPDIDIDLCRDRRQEVINYVTEKYGHDRVAQIITFGSMAARAAIRDVGRALDIPLNEVDKIAKLIPTNTTPINKALEENEQLRTLYQTDIKIKELLDHAMKLEGLSRHVSKHAAGVVIAPEPITNFMPFYKNPSDDNIITHFEMKAVENLGLLKFDFLGLATLTIIQKTLQFIKSQGKELDISRIPFDDAKTYELLGSGETTAIFQLESKGMRDILVRMKPNVFEDLIALVALYRPGPMAWIDDFIKRKKGLEQIEYKLPALKSILHETYGITIYQEQVMMIANKIAGFSMGQADILRKAMGKKLKDVMAKQKEEFIKGAVNNGIPAEDAKKLFEDLEPFAEYGFNKSHSASYAYLAYQTAYLKAHFPVEFMAANLSLAMRETGKIVNLITSCRDMSIKVLPPDINHSQREFTISDGAIRFGLEAVKGVGAAAVEVLLKEREKGEFKDIDDFINRVDSKKVNKKVIESLIKAGALDSLFYKNNGAGLDIKQRCIFRAEAFERLNQDNGKRHMTPGLFAGDTDMPLQDVKSQWDEDTLLKNEKEAMGFYLSGHPLRQYRSVLRARGVMPIIHLSELDDRADVIIAGVINDIKLKAKAKGTTKYLTIEDETAMIDCLVYVNGKNISSDYEEGDTVIITGQLLKLDNSIKVITKDVERLDKSVLDMTEIYYIDCHVSEDTRDILCSLRNHFEDSNGGNGRVFFRLHLPEYCVTFSSNLTPSQDLERQLEAMGCGSIRLNKVTRIQ
ncbi:MAG: DNA polymerase III subunit alpha [Thermodesulfovibrionales bacterium]|nr:DNA polymerase III subunit alpha [Thermodesulfovibrionales bacterium]